MNKEIWRMYGVRLGKICSHVSMALAALLAVGIIVIVAAPLIFVAKALIGIMLVLISLGLILMREGFADFMFSTSGLDSTQAFADAYTAALPAIGAVAIVCAAAAVVLLAVCERRGERSVGRMVFSCLILLLAVVTLALSAAAGG